MKKFPGTTKGMIGMAINGKLTELRLKFKHAIKDDGSNEPEEI
jgi:hypothetical protein